MNIKIENHTERNKRNIKITKNENEWKENAKTLANEVKVYVEFEGKTIIVV